MVRRHLAGHPLQGEAVVWCMGRKDLLSCFFALSTLLAYTNYLTHRRKNRYVLSLIFFLCGLLTKPSIMTVPLILILIDAYKNRAVTARDFLGKLPFFLLSFIALLVNHLNAGRGSAESTSLWFRIACIPSVLEGWFSRLLLLQKPEPFYCWPTAIDYFPIVARSSPWRSRRRSRPA